MITCFKQWVYYNFEAFFLIRPQYRCIPTKNIDISYQLVRGSFLNLQESTTWSNNSCILTNYDRNTHVATCACTHLTTFKITKKDFTPEINVITQRTILSFTITNLIAYPVPLLTIVVFLSMGLPCILVSILPSSTCAPFF